jgi:hypothetical protein
MGLTSDEKRAFGDSKRRNTPLKENRLKHRIKKEASMFQKKKHTPKRKGARPSFINGIVMTQK